MNSEESFIIEEEQKGYLFDTYAFYNEFEKDNEGLRFMNWLMKKEFLLLFKHLR